MVGGVQAPVNTYLPPEWMWVAYGYRLVVPLWRVWVVGAQQSPNEKNITRARRAFARPSPAFHAAPCLLPASFGRAEARADDEGGGAA